MLNLAHYMHAKINSANTISKIILPQDKTILQSKTACLIPRCEDSGIRKQSGSMSVPGDTAHCLDFATRLQHVKKILQRSSTDYIPEVDADLQKDVVIHSQGAEVDEVQRPAQPSGQPRKESDTKHEICAKASSQCSVVRVGRLSLVNR